MNDKNTTFPWLQFLLDHGRYAINSQNVRAIIPCPSTITPLHNVPEYIKGIINFRGEIVPLLELRKLYGFETQAEAFDRFKKMLRARKQDHIHWVEELERCTETEEPFTLATDPHKCAFGKWYDSYSSDIESVNFHLHKIDRPHRLLHEAALQVQQCSKQHTICQKSECVKVSLHKAKEHYMPQVVKLLEEAEEVFHGSYQGKVIILECDAFSMGMIVDDVLSVEYLQAVEAQQDSASALSLGKHGVISVARGRSEEELILMVDGAYLTSLCKSETKHSLPA